MSFFRKTKSTDQSKDRDRADPRRIAENSTTMPTSSQISRSDSSTGTRYGKPPEDKVIESFVNSYESSGYTAYEKLTKAATKIVTEKLEQNEILCEVYNRGQKGFANGWAKDPVSVRRTIRRRQEQRKMSYKAVDEIKNDMHDLAGLRIALYSPNDFKTVGDIIEEHFERAKPPQDWPDQLVGPHRYRSLDAETGNISGRNSRFPGYFARHYRVKIKEKDANEPAIKGKTVEIQLVSLLMHAWSKMHHELVYKPRPGIPAVDEDDERLLDISNGVIIAGEQVLRQIQINLDRKKSRARLHFRDSDDLWNHIGAWSTDQQNTMSEKQKAFIDSCRTPLNDLRPMLYNSLVELKMDNPESLDKLFQAAYTVHEKSESSWHTGILSMVDFLYVGLAAISPVIKLEKEQLKLPIPNWTVSPTGHSRPSRQGVNISTKSELGHLVRYYAIIICNSLRWYSSRYKHWAALLAEDLGRFSKTRPTGDEFLEILDLRNWLNQDIPKLERLREFCENFFTWRDTYWQIGVRFSMLCCFLVPSRWPFDDVSEVNMCPADFIDILNNRFVEKPGNEDHTTRMFTTYPVEGKNGWKVVSLGSPTSFKPRRVGFTELSRYLNSSDTLPTRASMTK